MSPSVARTKRRKSTPNIDNWNSWDRITRPIVFFILEFSYGAKGKVGDL